MAAPGFTAPRTTWSRSASSPGSTIADPRIDPQHVLQEFKKHPFIAKLLEGGKMVRYGAKSLPYGGWWCIPPLAGDGWMILGDSAGFLNSQRLKGIHLAIKSGMLAAETAFEAMAQNRFLARRAGHATRTRWRRAGSRPSCGRCATSTRASRTASSPACSTPASSNSPAAAACARTITTRPGIAAWSSSPQLPADGGAEAHIINAAKGDGKLTFDKLTDLYHSGTKHEEDQPAHLVIHDTNICNERCVKEFGNPCKNFCPASVYEMVEAADTPERSARST